MSDNDTPKIIEAHGSVRCPSTGLPCLNMTCMAYAECDDERKEDECSDESER